MQIELPTIHTAWAPSVRFWGEAEGADCPTPLNSVENNPTQTNAVSGCCNALAQVGKHRSLRLRFPVVRCPEFIDQSRHGGIEPIYGRTRAFDFVVQGGELVQNPIELERYRVQRCYGICHDVHTISPGRFIYGSVS